MLIIIPLPLFFAQTVFGVGGLTAWVVIGMIWAFCSAIAVVLYPLYESRQALLLICRGIVKVGALRFYTRASSLLLIGTSPQQDAFAKGSGKFVHPEKTMNA